MGKKGLDAWHRWHWARCGSDWWTVRLELGVSVSREGRGWSGNLRLLVVTLYWEWIR
jgi:hypothetical protein